jgi:hypothetical protein
MTTSRNFPQLYLKPVALNSDDHAQLTISPSAGGLSFAAAAQTVPLAAVEFIDAGRQLPVIFIQTADNRIVPLALMGLEQNENLFIGADGNWSGGYIPAYIRRYPFITVEHDGQTVVCFDENFDGFNQNGGLPLFEAGAPTSKTHEILAFVEDFNNQMRQSEQLGAMLAQAGLLRQIDAQATLNDGRSYALNGMLVVDEQRLAQLPDSDIVKMFRNGTLALIHAHLLSIRNLSGLVDRKQSRKQDSILTLAEVIGE